MQEICFVGVPRSGTSHVMELLNNFPRVNSRGELFHDEGCYVLTGAEVDAVSAVVGMQFTDGLHPALVKFVRSNPGMLLDIIGEKNRDKNVHCFKIFPGHLSLSQIEMELLSRKNLKFIIIQRRFIDVFISLTKAESANGKYHKMNTTDLQVSLDFHWLTDLLITYQQWYKNVTNLIISSGRRYGEVIYEKDIDCPAEECVRKLTESMAACGLDLAAFAERPAELKGLRRQDTGSDYQQKVINWNDVVAQLKERQIYDVVFSEFDLTRANDMRVDAE